MFDNIEIRTGMVPGGGWAKRTLRLCCSMVRHFETVI